MHLKGKVVFVLEDDPTNLSILGVVLEREGATMKYDRWGRETLQRIKELKPVDLILLDLNLPGAISGYDVFEQIRLDPDLKPIPIVAVSADDPVIAMPKVRSMGFDGFISKPIRFDLFGGFLARVLNGEKVWAPR
ncbi:MAG: response regulator [Anaerolinea sp.]|nr:response regulator [Anaerolinea sp.]MCC6976284.1 response regulator [Anaerolineae bacterium]